MQKIFFKEVGSTMDEARKEAAYLRPNSHLMLIADKQLSGRGQKGKKWESQVGGIYFTVASCIESYFSLNGYSLFIGILLHKTLAKFGIETKLKWPNDIFDSLGRKLSGILIETYKNDNKQILLTGIGINLSNIPNLDSEVSSILNLTKKSISRIDILSIFEEYFENELSIFINQSFGMYYDSWNKLDFYKNKIITFDNGKNKIKGINKGVDENGRLLIHTNERILSFVSGSIII